MSTSLRTETAPPMWAIERGPGAAPVLRVGSRRVPVSAIRSIERREERERDIKGLLVMAAIFAAAAFVFVVGVVDIGWRTRFLLGAAFMIALAFVSLVETMSIGPVRFVALTIDTSEGRVVFTTPDPADASALEGRVAAEMTGLGKRN